MVALVAVLAGRGADAGLLVVGLLVAVLAGAGPGGAAPAWRLGIALGAGAVTMPLAHLVGPAAWVLAGVHIGAALGPGAEPPVSAGADGARGVGGRAHAPVHRA